MKRNEDISFGTASPMLTCKSSFSSFLVEPSTPLFESGGFSFHSSGGNTLEFSTPALSLSSFTFFSPGPISEQGNHETDFSGHVCRVDSVLRGIFFSFNLNDLTVYTCKIALFKNPLLQNYIT